MIITEVQLAAAFSLANTYSVASVTTSTSAFFDSVFGIAETFLSAGAVPPFFFLLLAALVTAEQQQQQQI